ncbi:MAG: hypothetical protein LAT82_03310 [Nanoarchaeota archaeon]|nr:hypothetical protein [Nanoarchaeota archaeon]
MTQKLLSSKEFEEHYPGCFEIYNYLILKRGDGIVKHLETHMTRFIKRNSKFVKEIEELFKEYKEKDSMHHFFRSKVVRTSIKELQKELHTTYSQFQSSQDSKKEQLFEHSESISDLLLIHKSTQERVESYDEIYSYLCSGVVSSLEKSSLTILDIGCGMNPLSIQIFIEQFKSSNVKWIGCDVHQEDMNYISKCYEKFKFEGEFFSCDLTREDEREKINTKNVDILFAFKVLDSLEHIQRNISFDILKELNYKIGVISFATFSLGRRKRIPITKRAWILKFLEREKWTYSIYETDNEAYIVYKKK